MADIFFECPRCKSNFFYSKNPNNEIVFFRINTKGIMVETKSDKEIGPITSGKIECTGCSYELTMENFIKWRDNNE